MRRALPISLILGCLIVVVGCLGPNCRGSTKWDWSKAARLQRCAEEGHIEAQVRYAELLVARGQTRQSAIWLHRAAGRRTAFLNTARYYSRKPDGAKEAEQWFLKAAGEGAWEASMELGLREYVKGDKTKAGKHFENAIAQGGAAAATVIGTVLWREHFDAPSAIKWLQRGAELGDGDAKSALGTAYSEGTGVPKDLSKAFYWYRAAAMDKSAQVYDLLRLARMLDEGTGTRRDPVAALDALRAARSKQIDDSDYQTPSDINALESRLSKEISSARARTN